MLLVLAVVGAGGFAVLSGGDGDTSESGSGESGDPGDSGDSGDPAQVVEQFLAATSSGNCATAIDQVTESSLAPYGGDRAAAVQDCQASVDQDEGLVGAGVSVEGTEVTSNDGTTATVALTATADGSTETTDITVRNEGGVWKIDVTSMGVGGSSAPGG